MKKSNPVTEAIDAVGGTLEDLAVICRVSRQAVHFWQKAGRIHTARHAVLVSRATGIPVERLAGVEDEKPKKGSGRRIHSSQDTSSVDTPPRDQPDSGLRPASYSRAQHSTRKLTIEIAKTGRVLRLYPAPIAHNRQVQALVSKLA